MDTTGERHDAADGKGRLLAGRYRVTRRLGRGGMGVVWQARDEVLGRQVALKELRTFSDAPPEQVGDLRLRMQREARAAARVRHPSVVAVHDIAEHEGRPVIVMELVDGPSLDDVLRRDGPLEPQEAARVGAEVLRALAAAHRAGVLHRDVKPANVLLERGGRVVLTDFGIAAVEDPADGAATRLTGTGDLVGSLDYLAPERARGEQPGPPSDVWSLGATLYAAVEGVSPFCRTSTWSTLNAIVVEPLPAARRAGPLGPALAELLHKDPARRPDAERAADLLAAVAVGTTGGTGAAQPAVTETLQLGRVPAAAARPARPGRPVERETAAQTVATRPAGAGRRRRGPVLAVAVAAVLLAGGGVGWALTSGDDDTATHAAGPSATAAPSRKDTGATAPAKEGGSDPSPEAGERASASASHTTPEAGKDESPHTPATHTARATPTHTGGGGGGGVPGPSCQGIGGGRFNCQVWRTAHSYDTDHRQRGVLNAGTNYFFCQSKLGFRETSGPYTNVWWAKTDDDSGNANVYVSDVYLKGGANDQPVPGLPVC